MPHSLATLAAQIVCQVIKTGWESDFTCEGVPSLAESSALINEFESLEPVSCAVHLAGDVITVWPRRPFQKISAVEFATRVDRCLNSWM